MAVITSDSFNRADGSLGGTSTDIYAGGAALPWTITDTWITSSNVLRRTGSGPEDVAYVDVSTTDCMVAGTLAAFAGSGEAFHLYARSTDANNFYSVEVNLTGVRLYKRVGGSYTQLGATQTAGIGDVVAVSCFGSSIKLLKNGAVLVNVTDTALAAGTFAGVHAKGALGIWRVDNFIVYDALELQVADSATGTDTITRAGERAVDVTENPIATDDEVGGRLVEVTDSGVFSEDDFRGQTISISDTAHPSEQVSIKTSSGPVWDYPYSKRFDTRPVSSPSAHASSDHDTDSASRLDRPERENDGLN